MTTLEQTLANAERIKLMMSKAGTSVESIAARSRVIARAGISTKDFENFAKDVARSGFKLKLK